MEKLIVFCLCLLPARSAAGQQTTLKIDGNSVNARMSPDGKQVVFAHRTGRNNHVFVASTRGENARQLTSGKHNNHSPYWSPDARRVIFCSNRSGINQVYSVGIDDRQLKQLTKSEHGAIMPKYSSDGWISYLQLHPRQGKSRPGDLIIQMGGRQRVVIRGQHVSDYAWSHNGRQICFSTVNRLHFYELATGKTEVVDTLKQDQRLFSHGAYEITWSPDDLKVACRIKFLGGRTQGTQIYGDSEVFLISADAHGGLEAISVSEIAGRPEAWIQRAFGGK